jgi:valyl-tRNA synthetase
MIMMGLHFTKEKPFSDVYIHALVRDEKGEKMSKTKGNVIDPLDMIEKYGADSLRFTLAALAAQGRDIRLSEKRIEGYRNFANKIWNASKYVLQNAENFEGKIINDVKDLDLSYEDKWIISKLQKTIQKAEDALTSYRYNDYANLIYDFFWHDYCDWYLEFTKERVYKGTDEDKQVALSTLIYVLDASLKLLHPVMPFITEEIWQYIPGKKENYLSLAKYPDVQNDLIFEEEENLIENIKELVVAIRAARAEFGIQPSQKINIYIKPESEKVEEILKLLKNPLSNLIRAQNLEISTNLSDIDNMATAISSIGQAFIDVAGAIDVQKEIERQEKLLSETEKYISIIEKKLSNENFLKKAPKDVVEKEKSLYEEQKERKAKILTIIENLKKLIS